MAQREFKEIVTRHGWIVKDDNITSLSQEPLLFVPGVSYPQPDQMRRAGNKIRKELKEHLKKGEINGMKGDFVPVHTLLTDFPEISAELGYKQETA